MANLGLSNGKFVELESDDDVDYELATEDRLFGSHINAIPIQSAVQGPRLFYGARFENQALPIRDAEVPLVQNQDQDTGLSFDKLYGKYAGAVESDDDYTVDSVDLDQIILRNKDGKKVIKELYNNTPFNRKTSLNNTTLVKPGDIVTKGQILAKSNYTDDTGTLAMGKNALVGLVAYKGHSMDDAIAVSQSFANKLTSEHSETHAIDIDHNIKINKNHFRSLFPENYKKEQLENVDDDGVVLPGTILKEGDPIFLSTKPRTINSSSFTSGKLTKGLAQAREDASHKWESPYDAEVIDVYKGRKGIKVLTRAYAPSKIGDKIVFRSGQKSFHKDTEVFTERGWVLIPDLTNTDKVMSLFNDSGTYYSDFSPVIEAHKYNFKGQLYTMDSPKASYSVTAGHRVFVNVNKFWKILPAMELVGKKVKFLSDGLYQLSMGVKQLDPDVEEEIELIRTEYDDEVHCIQVKGLGVILTRYNGKQVWIGNSIISEIIPDDQMPETENGEKLEVLLNQLGLPSRTNSSLPYELALGKVAAKNGQPIVLPGFTKNGESWRDIVNSKLAEAGLSAKERIYDPKENRFLEDPIAVGRGYIMKLHHTAECYDDQTEVLTQDGWKFWKDVTNRDRLATCKSIKSPITFEKPIELVATAYSGSMVRFNNSAVDFCVTPNHRMYVKERSEFDFIFAEDLSGTNYVFPTLDNILNVREVEVDCKKIKTVNYNGLVFCAEVSTGILLVRRNGKPMLCGNSKVSARGQGSYDQYQQPTKGGGESAQSKRLSGLETTVMLSSGAYNNIREASILRGQQNDEYWRQLKMGLNPKPPGIPFVWDKFNKMLMGAGINPKNEGKGQIRLTPMTDSVLNSYKPIELRNAELVNMKDMSPIPGGLFDTALVSANAWGKITLPKPVPNPAYEKSIRILLGLKKSEFEDILKGDKPLRFKKKKPTN